MVLAGNSTLPQLILLNNSRITMASFQHISIVTLHSCESCVKRVFPCVTLSHPLRACVFHKEFL